MSYNVLLDGVRIACAGAVVPDPLSERTITADLTGTGALSAVIDIETHDGDGVWQPGVTLTLSGSDTASGSATLSSTNPYTRAVARILTGAGASLSARMESQSAADKLSDIPVGGTTGQTLAKASDADGDVAWATPAAGGDLLTGNLVWVDAMNGDDATGVAGNASKPFLTIQAAITAAVSGYTVVVRPGTYSEAITLKNGVNVFGLPGVKMQPPSGGGTLFTDGGSTVSCLIDGGIDFESATGGDAFASFTGSGTIVIRGRRLVFGNAAATGIQAGGNCTVIVEIAEQVNGRNYVIAAATAAKVTLRADSIVSLVGVAVQVDGGNPTVVVEAAQSIICPQILVDSASTGATRVSIKAPTITATVNNASGIALTHSAAARYDIEADTLVCGVLMTAPSAEIHTRAGTHTPNAPGTAAVAVVSGKAFASADEIVGTTGLAPVGAFGADANIHVLRGRVIADAAQSAVKIFDDAAKLTLYPGVVLIAGGANASIANGGTTPTVVCMGAIAANTAADVGVTIAVGSLLVDAAVA